MTIAAARTSIPSPTVSHVDPSYRRRTATPALPLVGALPGAVAGSVAGLLGPALGPVAAVLAVAAPWLASAAERIWS
jgi:cobalamin synthase